MTDEQAERIAKALELIAGSLVKLANPPVVANLEPPAPDDIRPGQIRYVKDPSAWLLPDAGTVR